MTRGDHTMLELDGREVRFSNPGKVFFPDHGYTKLDLCEYYLSVADACLAHLRDRPTTMKRFTGGAGGEFFFQKRVPPTAPEWLQQMTLSFPSGRSVRCAAMALAREIERRVPKLATTAWWKEERHGVFIDYNQNARDRMVASAYSVRPVPDALVCCPVTWDEVPDVELEDFRLDTVPERVRTVGDPSARLDASVHSLPLLALADRDEREGLSDAPWPPHFKKQSGEAKRVQPSRAKKDQPV